MLESLATQALKRSSTDDGATGEETKINLKHAVTANQLFTPGQGVRSSQPKPPLTLQSVHDDAIKHLQEGGHLSSADYQKIGCATLQEVLASVDNTVAQNTRGAKIGGVFKSLLERLGKFERAIDMLAESSQQVLGLSLVGLIWGSLKLFLVIERDLANTSTAVIDLLDGVLRGLHSLDIYVDIFGASGISLLEKPLVGLYATLITFGVEVANLSDKPVRRMYFLWSTRSLLRRDIVPLIDKIKKAEQLVNRMAMVQHMYLVNPVQSGQALSYVDCSLLCT